VLRVLLPITLTTLLLSGYSLGDRMPLLNPYELVRWSGAAFLPEVGTRFIADQQKLGGSAIVVGWAAYIVAAIVAAVLIERIWYLLK
jgi:hypothetical protein